MVLPGARQPNKATADRQQASDKITTIFGLSRSLRLAFKQFFALSSNAAAAAIANRLWRFDFIAKLLPSKQIKSIILLPGQIIILRHQWRSLSRSAYFELHHKARQCNASLLSSLGRCDIVASALLPSGQGDLKDGQATSRSNGWLNGFTFNTAGLVEKRLSSGRSDRKITKPNLISRLSSKIFARLPAGGGAPGRCTLQTLLGAP